jgi:SAM-dependent methyltransferase
MAPTFQQPSTRLGDEAPRQMTRRHLDLGCGAKPRNPYRSEQLFGVDIRTDIAGDKAEIRRADLFREPIPFGDGFFDSVSAYDFLEHVPRTSVGANDTRFPFIEVMNEVWRVLKDGGLFYASTPAYPHPAAFQDPTHVNIITQQTHSYFTRPELLGRMYGFKGDFECVRCHRIQFGELEYEPLIVQSWLQHMRAKFRRSPYKNSHLVWEFRAIKRP